MFRAVQNRTALRQCSSTEVWLWVCSLETNINYNVGVVFKLLAQTAPGFPLNLTCHCCQVGTKQRGNK